MLFDWWFVAALAAETTAAATITTMSADPMTGTFGLCFWRDCTLAFSASLYQITTGTTHDVLADFSALDSANFDPDGLVSPVITRTDAKSTPGWSNGTLFARTCLSTACTPRPSNESEFESLRVDGADALGIRLDIAHVETDDAQIVRPLESFSVARGALRLNLSVAVSPLATQSATLPVFAVSFLVATFENFVPVATASSGEIGAHMRIQLGSNTFLDLPHYRTINGVETMIDISFAGQSSGPHEDLVLVTLTFGDVTSSIGYEAAFSSPSLVDGATEAPSSPPTAVVDSTGAVMPTQLYTAPGGTMGLCLDADCSSDGVLSMVFAGLQVNGSSPMQMTRFARSPALHFNPQTRQAGITPEIIRCHMEAFGSQSAVRPVSSQALSDSPVDFRVDLTHYLSASSESYGPGLVDLPRGALDVWLAVLNWEFASSNDTLALSMAITLEHSNGSLAPIATEYSVERAANNVTLHLADGNAIEFPTVAIASDANVPVGVQVSRQGRDDDVLLVTFTFRAFTGPLYFRHIVIKPNAISIATPTPTPTPSAATPTPTPTLWAPKPTRTVMTVDPATGTFGMCYWANCINSLSLSLYQLTVDTTIDTVSNEVTSATVVADFSVLDPADQDDNGLADPIIRRSDQNSSPSWNRGTLYARACISTRCNPRPSNESEFQRLLTGTGDDAIGVKLAMELVDVDGTQIQSVYESYDLARGALRLDLQVAVSPLVGEPDTLPMFGISFLVAAYENRAMTIGTTQFNVVDGHMYLKRLQFGSDMFVDLPMYATINGANTTIYTSVHGETTGDLQGLVRVTLMFGPVAKSITYEAALSSVMLVDNITTTEAPTPSPVHDSSGELLPTQMRTRPCGVFGMCLDSTCSTDGTLTMGFSGLQLKGSAPLVLSRFANSPAFQFSSPTRQTLPSSTSDVVRSSFVASVPRSAIRPPSVAVGTGDPTLAADVALFLADANVVYGDQTLDVPRGAVKFTVEFRDWIFGSSSDTLELSMAISLERSDDSLASLVTDFFSKSDGTTLVLVLQGNRMIEFPMFALADGSQVPVGVRLAPQSLDGKSLAVTFTFPSFSQQLTYDPVMKASATSTTSHTPTPTPTPSPTPTPTMGRTGAPMTVLEKPKRQVDSWSVAGFLLGFLALVVVLSAIQCYKRTSFKFDFSKIIP